MSEKVSAINKITQLIGFENLSYQEAIDACKVDEDTQALFYLVKEKATFI
jgi:hypothetical protein